MLLVTPLHVRVSDNICHYMMSLCYLISAQDLDLELQHDETGATD